MFYGSIFYVFSNRIKCFALNYISVKNNRYEKDINNCDSYVQYARLPSTLSG